MYCPVCSSLQFKPPKITKELIVTILKSHAEVIFSNKEEVKHEHQQIAATKTMVNQRAY